MRRLQVSDAGMPSISDPGHELVLALYRADIPSCSVTRSKFAWDYTALHCNSGNCHPQPFYFYGFLPRKKKEQT